MFLRVFDGLNSLLLTLLEKARLTHPQNARDCAGFRILPSHLPSPIALLMLSMSTVFAEAPPRLLSGEIQPVRKCVHSCANCQCAQVRSILRKNPAVFCSPAQTQESPLLCPSEAKEAALFLPAEGACSSLTEARDQEHPGTWWWHLPAG